MPTNRTERRWQQYYLQHNFHFARNIEIFHWIKSEYSLGERLFRCSTCSIKWVPCHNRIYFPVSILFRLFFIFRRVLCAHRPISPHNSPGCIMKFMRIDIRKEDLPSVQTSEYTLREHYGPSWFYLRRSTLYTMSWGRHWHENSTNNEADQSDTGSGSKPTNHMNLACTCTPRPKATTIRTNFQKLILSKERIRNGLHIKMLTLAQLAV